ncbi:MAG TPA: acetyl-CoA carboxylase biotin carboxyl carrier protein [Rhabdochlamydiaceae bacterium]|nr:acetyl-CoA carboxylase biotin carboxyl carrier protein [Rhabdochlamydiaceae bacterium]
MELKQIKELMAAMEKAGIKKLSIKETTGFELQLERHEEGTHPSAIAHAPLYPHAYPQSKDIGHQGHFPPPPHSHHRVSAHEEVSEKREEKVEGKFVTSPMVGTFYSSPSPEDPHFVKVGDRIDENTVVCIIEAMKVMNEVKAGISGMIAEILVDNAHPVEFGTKMFRVV